MISLAQTDWLSHRQWESVTAPLTGGSAYRSPELLQKIVAQFRVESSPRYQALPNATWCNCYATDVTRALGCEIPHWQVRAELSANGMMDWLENDGARHGWVELISRPVVETKAKAGFPTVVGWVNPSGLSGHIALCVPAPTGASGVHIAQAGRQNFSCRPLAFGFGDHGPLRFYTHL